jgi:hypothetical protein
MPHKGENMKRLLLLIAIVLLSGCASVGRDRAVQAHQADIGSTFVALGLGAVEGNILWPIALPLKWWQMRQIAALPDAATRAEAYMRVAAVTNGAVANNVCVATALLIAATVFPPAAAATQACPLVGIGWGAQEWNGVLDPERFHAAFCEEWKKEREGNTCSPFVATN